MNPNVTLILITTIISIHIFAWLTPGPIFVLILRNSLVYSRKTGIWTALGIAIGNIIHIAYSVTGIALVISTSPIAFNIIKYLGVGYLTYLGIKTFFIQPKPPETNAETKDKDLPILEAVKTGFLTNILSPKASLFFASIFASVLSSGAPYWVVLVLWFAMPLNSFVMATILSSFFTLKKVRATYDKYQFVANKLLGAALIVFAVIILFKK